MRQQQWEIHLLVFHLSVQLGSNLKVAFFVADQTASFIYVMLASPEQALISSTLSLALRSLKCGAHTAEDVPIFIKVPSPDHTSVLQTAEHYCPNTSGYYEK